MNFCPELLLAITLSAPLGSAEDVGSLWGTAEREREFYPVVELPLPPGAVIEAGAFLVLPDDRLAVGTRHGDLYIVSGIDGPKPEPKFELFATGLDEIFGLAYRDGSIYVTQSCELSRLTDTDGDGRADEFETVSDAWGYENYHEYAFGTDFDADGNLFVALGLSMSYHSRALFRGWVIQVTPEGESIPIASGLRSPGGIGPNEHDALFYVESQGPWNSSCSLKAIEPGKFMGHPISFNWYPFAPNLGAAPVEPESGSRVIDELERVPELVPYAVIFPYIRMGRSITGFTVDRTGGSFGPFKNQIFVGDYTLSIVMRATTEEINGVWQGACYPFREGLSTGLLDVGFTPAGSLLCGGTNRGWPVRGLRPFALERLDWSGVTPFEIERISISPEGFDVRFTLPVDRESGSDPSSYGLGTFTHIYHAGYGGPEVDQSVPQVESVTLSEDGLEARLVLDRLIRGHVYEFDLAPLSSAAGDGLLHRNAYYTVNEVPQERNQASSHPVPPSPRWLTYPGAEGPGNGKHVVLIAAEQEYRSEQAMPMLARVLSEHHGFDCTVIFGQNEAGEVDPTLPIRWEDESVVHDIPGLEHIQRADLLIVFTRLLSLPEEQLAHLHEYLDSGKPIIGLRTANHGFLDFGYKPRGVEARFGEDVLGGAFRSHHGRWHQDSTRGVVVEENRLHPILSGVSDVWGPSDVYRTFDAEVGLPRDCLPLLLGQPLTGRSSDDPPNEELIPLPVAWTKTWQGANEVPARVFHSTMGSARDFESEGLRRLLVNAAYWCLELEDSIRPGSSVELVGDYAPLESGFNYEALGVVPRPPRHYQ